MRNASVKLMRLTAFIAVLILTACNTSMIPERNGTSLLAGFNLGGANKNAHRVSDPFGNRGTGSQVSIRQSQGTDEFLGPGGGSGPPLFDTTDDNKVSLNLVDTSIAYAARAVLGEALGLNHTIDPNVTGNVTLQTTQPMDKETLLETFQTILELNGATLNRTNELITIVPFADAPRTISRLSGENVIGPRIVAVPLQYVSPKEMTRVLESIVGEGVTLDASSGRNVMLISGTRDEINATIDAINLFDVDVMKGKSIALFTLKTADPEAIANELVTIFDSGPNGALEDVVQFIPNARLSSVLVISTRSKYIAEARKWVANLDATAGGSRRRPVVYALENRSAEELAPILAEMIGAGLLDETEEAEQAAQSGPKVIADPAKNAVIVWGDDQEREDIGRLIQTLDTTPVQVLLEATIAEVTLTDELNFGLRWFFNEGRTTGSFTDIASGAVASEFPGLSFLYSSTDVRVALNALSSITRVNVISSPSLMVLDNQEASLQIGDEVPIATQSSVDRTNVNAPITNTISFRDTGIILTVRPRVSSSGRIVLDIDQEVSSVKNTTTSGIDSPTISQRKISTNVVVQDGTTLALGGLIQDDSNDSRSKVPGAGDIPILGTLFKSKTDRRNRTELLILITPRVVRDGAEARQITDEFRRRLGEPNSLITNPGTSASTRHRILN